MSNLGDKNTVFNLYVQRNLTEYYARLLLETSQNKTIEITLDTLFTFLSVGQKMRQNENSPNILLNLLIAIPGINETLEQLQYNESKVIYGKTVKLLQKYFELEQELNL